MKVFITGINGVLGSTLKEKLRSQGHDVWGCDLTHSDDRQIMRADIAERRQLRAVLDYATCSVIAPEDDKIDVLFHLAAEFGRVNGAHFYEQLWRSNCTGTRNVIEECVTRDIRMVFASSSEAYGSSRLYPNDGYLFEHMLDEISPQFHNEYSLTKWVNEHQITMAARNQSLRAVILRFFNIYGPPERYSPYRSVVCQFVYQLLAGLPLTVNRGGYRTHLWIGDWANTVSRLANENILSSLDHDYNNLSCPGSGDTPGVPVFNIGSQEYESVEDLYRKLAVLIPHSKSKVTFVDKEEANTATKRPSTTLAQLKLHHDPSTSLIDGLAATVEWMKKTYGF